MVLSEEFVGVESNYGAASGVQVGVVLLVLPPRHGVRSAELHVGDALGEDNLDLSLLDQHVVEDVVHKSHVKNVLVSRVEEVFVRWHVVTNDVVGLPSSEQREARPEVELHCVIHNFHVACGDVADVVSVVHVLAGGGQKGLEVLNT